MTSVIQLSLEQGQKQLFWVEGTAQAVLCEKLLRHLPGKRWVCLAQWGEQQVVAKIFTQARHAQHELTGIDALAEAEIPTAKLLHHGWIKEKSLYIILYEYIPHKHDLDHYWQTANEIERDALIQKLIIKTAQLHQAGLYQQDLHLRNFILANNKIYVLDAASIQQAKNQSALDELNSLKNIALLFGQFPPDYDSKIEKFYLIYTQQRNLIFTLSSIELLKKFVFKARYQRLAKYGRKVFRSSTQFVARKTWQYFSVCHKGYDTPGLQQGLLKLDELIASPDAIVLKAGNSSTVVKVCIDNRYFVIKRYNFKNTWLAIKRAFKPTRAAISWCRANQLQLINIDTPKPIAMVEKRLGPLRRVSYFISEYMAAENMQNYFATTHSPEHVVLIAEKIKLLLANLKAVRILHDDMKATNILLVAYNPVLLDLDGMRLYNCSWLWRKKVNKDKKRFLQNWQDKPEILQFFKDC